jgi:MYXO-CTERM domain-containing protein
MSAPKYIRLVACLAALGAGLWVPNVARAEERFPAAIQDAAGLNCAPSCLLCHTTNPGTATSWAMKGFGVYMGTHGLTAAADTSVVATAYAQYLADPAQAVGAARIQAGLDPDTGLDICIGPTYGCGAHVARKAPPRDFSAALWALGAVVAGALLRRRKSPSR